MSRILADGEVIVVSTKLHGIIKRVIGLDSAHGLIGGTICPSGHRFGRGEACDETLGKQKK